MFSGVSEFMPVARLWASSSKPPPPDGHPPGVQNSAPLTHKSAYRDSRTEPSPQQETKNIPTPVLALEPFNPPPHPHRCWPVMWEPVFDYQRYFHRLPSSASHRPEQRSGGREDHPVFRGNCRIYISEVTQINSGSECRDDVIHQHRRRQKFFLFFCLRVSNKIRALHYCWGGRGVALQEWLLL